MKYSVLTYSFGNYEKNRAPSFTSPDVEYVMVSDKNPDKPFIHKTTTGPSNWLKTLHVKTHPFDFTSSEWVVVMDYSIEILKDITPLVEYCRDKGIEAMFISSPYATTWKKEIYPNPIWTNRNPNLKLEVDWLNRNFKDSRLNIESMFYILHRSEFTAGLFNRIDERNRELKKTGSDPRPSQVVYSAVIANEYPEEVKSGKISFMSSYQIRGAGNLMCIYQHGTNNRNPPLKCRDRVNILGMDYEPVSFKWLDETEPPKTETKTEDRKHVSGFDEWDE